MIIKGGKEINKIEFRSKLANVIYKGSKLIWEYIRSCFGKGIWVNEKEWRNTDGWKN